MSNGLEKAIAPFSVVIITLLFAGNVYFVNKTVERIEMKIEGFDARMDQTEKDIAVLKTQMEKKPCSNKFSNSSDR